MKEDIRDESYIDHSAFCDADALGNLAACYEVGQVDTFQKEADLRWTDRFIWGQEFDFGWYEDGRFAWELLDVKALDHPIPAKGQLGIWNYKEANSY